MWMSHPNVTGVVTVLDSAFYGGWDTLGWVAAVAPAYPSPPDAGWPVSEGEVVTLVGLTVAAQLPAAVAAGTTGKLDRTEANSTFAPLSVARQDLRPTLKVPAQRVTMLTNFATGHGWASNAVGTINLNDTSDAALGSQHVSVLTSGGGNVGGQRSEISKTYAAFDMTTHALKVWIKVDALTNLSAVNVLVGSDASNYYNVAVYFGTSGAANNVTTTGQWATLTVDLANASTVGAPPAKTACTYIVLRAMDLGGGAGAKASVHFGGIALVDKPPVAKAIVTLGFDDGYLDQFTNARAKMDQYGFPGVAYVIQDLIGPTAGATYMGLDQLHLLEDRSGWEVAAHSLTGADHTATGGFTSLTGTQLRANLEQHKAWLIANQFRGVDHFAIPQGLWNEAVISTVRDYFTTARTTAPGTYEQVPPGLPLRMRTQPINAGTALATLTALVDQAVANRSWLQFYTHRVLPSGAVGTQIDTTTFNGLVDYIAGSGALVRTPTDALSLAAV